MFNILIVAPFQLNAQAIGSLQDEFAGLELEIDKLIERMNEAIESSNAFIADMQTGVEPHQTGKVLAIVNRREAIRTACMLAQPGDIILVAGKGHEDYQEIMGVKHHFDDKEVIKEVFNLI